EFAERTRKYLAQQLTTVVQIEQVERGTRSADRWRIAARVDHGQQQAVARDGKPALVGPGPRRRPRAGPARCAGIRVERGDAPRAGLAPEQDLGLVVARDLKRVRVGAVELRLPPRIAVRAEPQRGDSAAAGGRDER